MFDNFFLFSQIRDLMEDDPVKHETLLKVGFEEYFSVSVQGY